MACNRSGLQFLEEASGGWRRQFEMQRVSSVSGIFCRSLAALARQELSSFSYTHLFQGSSLLSKNLVVKQCMSSTPCSDCPGPRLNDNREIHIRLFKCLQSTRLSLHAKQDGQPGSHYTRNGMTTRKCSFCMHTVMINAQWGSFYPYYDEFARGLLRSPFLNPTDLRHKMGTPQMWPFLPVGFHKRLGPRPQKFVASECAEYDP